MPFRKDATNLFTAGSVEGELDFRDVEVKGFARDALTDTVQFTTNLVAKRTAEGSPVRTGKNRASYRWKVSKSRLIGTVRSTSGYGGWLEIGTKDEEPRPHARPAAERSKDEGVKYLREKIFANS